MTPPRPLFWYSFCIMSSSMSKPFLPLVTLVTRVPDEEEPAAAAADAAADAAVDAAVDVDPDPFFGDGLHAAMPMTSPAGGSAPGEG